MDMASNLTQAITTVHTPDCVLLDLHLPDCAGLLLYTDGAFEGATADGSPTRRGPLHQTRRPPGDDR
jgi:hypothetical protein